MKFTEAKLETSIIRLLGSPGDFPACF